MTEDEVLCAGNSYLSYGEGKLSKGRNEVMYIVENGNLRNRCQMELGVQSLAGYSGNVHTK